MVETCSLSYGSYSPPYGAGTDSDGYYKPDPSETSDCSSYTFDLQNVGGITALLPEASDAGSDASLVVDGASGDTNFAFGKVKALATVGEYSHVSKLVVGVPDGMGAYLTDDSTVRVIVQSESYGTISAYESHPWYVNSNAASYTGSHVQYVDYDRTKLKNFMSHTGAASAMVKGMGNVIETFYNLKGELVGPRAADGSPTTTGAHFSNTDKDGNYVMATKPTYADWILQSLCSAHLEEAYQWGPGIGLEDDIFVTNEEWIAYDSAATTFVGISAHAVDLATKTAYALGVFTQGGFEKVIEFSADNEEYVAFSPSGYNGNIYGDNTAVLGRRNSQYTRSDGQPYVWPQDIVPARVYIGKKGYDEQGNPADDFLSRNGLRYGKLYGFATDTTASGVRDDWHKVNYKGAKVNGGFYPTSWSWDGNVVNFEDDGSWNFQDAPLTAPTGFEFWTAKGPNEAGKKTEHNSPAFRSDYPSAFTQSSTAGYFGDYVMPNLGQVLSNLPTGKDFPDSIPAFYELWQGETKVSDLIDLGGKGQLAAAAGHDATLMTDSSTTHETFEDVDGFEVIAAADGKRYAVILEDGGNKYGERSFIAELDPNAATMDYKLIMISGGSGNTRIAAQVGIPAGTNANPTSHEFSGTLDLSGMLTTDLRGNYLFSASDDGYVKHDAEMATYINDKTLVIGLQGHSLTGGVNFILAADRGGQWLAYQPSLAGGDAPPGGYCFHGMSTVTVLENEKDHSTTKKLVRNLKVGDKVLAARSQDIKTAGKNKSLKFATVTAVTHSPSQEKFVEIKTAKTVKGPGNLIHATLHHTFPLCSGRIASAEDIKKEQCIYTTHGESKVLSTRTVPVHEHDETYTIEVEKGYGFISVGGIFTNTKTQGGGMMAVKSKAKLHNN